MGLRDRFAIGLIVEDNQGRQGRITSIRKTQAVYNILHTGTFEADDFDKLTIINTKDGINSVMNKDTQNLLKSISESKAVPQELLEKVYNKSMLHGWKPDGNFSNPKAYALAEVANYAERYKPNDIDGLFESKFGFSDSGGHRSASSGVGPEFGSSLGGVGGSATVGNGAAGLGSGGASALLYDEKKPKKKSKDKDKEIKEWAESPETVKKFTERYGKEATTKISEATKRMMEEVAQKGFQVIKDNFSKRKAVV